jgi:hypothetical protein
VWFKVFCPAPARGRSDHARQVHFMVKKVAAKLTNEGGKRVKLHFLIEPLRLEFCVANEVFGCSENAVLTERTERTKLQKC